MAGICFFRLGATPLFVPGSTRTFGGAEVRALTFARGLARQRTHDVTFAVRPDDGIASPTVEGIHVVPMPAKQGGITKLWNSVRRRLTENPMPYAAFTRLSADVVACFGVHDPTANVIAAARARRASSMLFLTSIEDVRPVDETATGKLARAEKYREYALRNANTVVVQTEEQRTDLRREFGRDGWLIRNPVDTAIDRELAATPKEHVLWVGRADCDVKRADICLRVAAACPDVPFCMVMNDCDSPLGARLLKDAPSNVRVIAHVPFHEIDRLYASAFLLINTSASEGFPNAFLQAAKLSTPIVSLDVNPDEMLTRHDFGEVAGTPEGMAEAIRRYHGDAELVAQKGKNARSYVLRFHELDARISELADVIAGSATTTHAA